MSFSLNNKLIDNDDELYFGNKSISKICLGDKTIYEKVVDPQYEYISVQLMLYNKTAYENEYVYNWTSNLRNKAELIGNGASVPYRHEISIGAWADTGETLFGSVVLNTEPGDLEITVGADRLLPSSGNYPSRIVSIESVRGKNNQLLVEGTDYEFLNGILYYYYA